MRRGVLFICWVALAGWIVTANLPAAEVRPPFGLAWGEAPDRLATLLQGAGAKIVEKGKSGARDMWTVEGLLQPRLKRTLFYFEKDALSEVELQYGDPAWDVARYDTFLGEVRAKVEQLYGPGTLIARQNGCRLSVEVGDRLHAVILLLRGTCSKRLPHRKRSLQVSVEPRAARHLILRALEGGIAARHLKSRMSSHPLLPKSFNGATGSRPHFLCFTNHTNQ
jgi:hypothetical protein